MSELYHKRRQIGVSAAESMGIHDELIRLITLRKELVQKLKEPVELTVLEQFDLPNCGRKSA